jgi:hypothetical protein
MKNVGYDGAQDGGGSWLLACCELYNDLGSIIFRVKLIIRVRNRAYLASV